MTCLDDGALRAHLDGQLTGSQESAASGHLRLCASCQSRLSVVSARRDVVARLLGTPAVASDAVESYTRFRQKFAVRMQESARPKRRFALWNAPVWGGLAAAGAAVLLFSFAPAQSLGEKFLQLLRVQKLAVVPINFSPSGSTGPGQAERLLTQAISDNVVVTIKPGKGTPVPDASIASGMAGFQVKALGSAAPSETVVTDEGAFHLTIDRDRMQAILDQAGRSDVQIPQAVQGSTVAVHIRKGVRLSYGNCAGQQRDASCVLFLQMPTPAVSLPPNFDISSVAEAALQITGMSAAEAHSFSQTVDWSSTIVIPIPQGESSYRPVAVDGVTGTLIESNPNGKDPGNYALLWLKNGIIYAVEGKGDSSQALNAAASLL